MITGATTGMERDYNSNSTPQLATVVGSHEYIKCAIRVLNPSTASIIMIADFGSSLGSNSVQAIETMGRCLRETGKVNEEKQMLVIFNDLPTNNWTSFFDHLARKSRCYGFVSGRSFYEQCLPSNSLSIGYSSTALHWLSCKPGNLSGHCCSAFAKPGEERQAFEKQAYRDYNAFLQHRSAELHLGGVLILAHCCVDEQGSTGCDQTLHLAYQCAQLYLTPSELLAFNHSTYMRSYAEYTDADLLTRHSFQLVKAGFVRVDSPICADYRDKRLTLDQFALAKARWIRSWSQSSLEQALESSGLRSAENIERISNQIWTAFEQKVHERPEEYDVCTFCTYMVLKKM